MVRMRWYYIAVGMWTLTGHCPCTGLHMSVMLNIGELTVTEDKNI
jgi:hypothetical protein